MHKIRWKTKLSNQTGAKSTNTKINVLKLSLIKLTSEAYVSDVQKFGPLGILYGYSD
jgi:hypothetical protein